MAEDKEIVNKEKICPKTINFKDGKVCYLQFTYDQKEYSVELRENTIEFRQGDTYLIYDKENKKMTASLKHACGAQGFGQSSNDHCPACDSTTKMSAYFPAPEHYQQVDQYCQGLEKLVQNNPLLLDIPKGEHPRGYEIVQLLAELGKTVVWSSNSY
ncbi:MAG: hypothetical protein Q8R37_03770 [Nanoarchaeota archaeon]|nr:hypothetical protein [Nanoarchaeota archaeon]